MNQLTHFSAWKVVVSWENVCTYSLQLSFCSSDTAYFYLVQFWCQYRWLSVVYDPIPLCKLSFISTNTRLLCRYSAHTGVVEVAIFIFLIRAFHWAWRLLLKVFHHLVALWQQLPHKSCHPACSGPLSCITLSPYHLHSSVDPLWVGCILVCLPVYISMQDLDQLSLKPHAYAWHVLC